MSGAAEVPLQDEKYENHVDYDRLKLRLYTIEGIRLQIDTNSI